MDSFYGGRPGISFVIIERYNSVQDMLTAFSQGGAYEKVKYGQYVIIDTVMNLNNKRSLENGLIYCRGLDYQEPFATAPDIKNFKDDKNAYELAMRRYFQKPGAGAIYIGQIAGPAGETPYLKFMSESDVQALDDEYKGTGELDVVSGKEQNKISYSYCNIRDKYGNYVGCALGFTFPYHVIEINGESLSAYDPTRGRYNAEQKVWSYTNLISKESGNDNKDPFHSIWKLLIPKGIHGADLFTIGVDNNNQQYYYEIKDYNATETGTVEKHMMNIYHKVIKEVTFDKEKVEFVIKYTTGDEDRVGAEFLNDLVAEAGQSATAAAISAQQASESATEAKTAQAAAQENANAAKMSENAAKNSEATAETYANNAAESAEVAADKATEAGNSASSAAVSASAAKDSQDAAKVSETNAEESATNAGTSAIAAANSAKEALTAQAEAEKSATAAAASQVAAKESETNAANSEETAVDSANVASGAASSAQEAQTNAANSATAASTSASEALVSQTEAEKSASAAKVAEANAEDWSEWANSYARGEGGKRENEATDSARYYYEQTLRIAQGLEGTLIPMGTIKFEDLTTATKQPGYMYNISNAFTSTEDFKDGGNVYYGPGANVYWTMDNYWDVMAPNSVTGVKGNNESSYRLGNVALSPANMKLPSSFKTAVERANIKPNDSLEAAFSKLAKYCADLQPVAFSGSYNNLSNIPMYYGSCNSGRIGGDLVKFSVTSDMTLAQMFSALPNQSSWEIMFNSQQCTLNNDMPVGSGCTLHIVKRDNTRGKLEATDYRTGYVYTAECIENVTSAWKRIPVVNPSNNVIEENVQNADTVDGKHASELQNYNNLSNRPLIPAAVAVKGAMESAYRTGNVNLTADNIGSPDASKKGKTYSSIAAFAEDLGKTINPVVGNCKTAGFGPDGEGWYFYCLQAQNAYPSTVMDLKGFMIKHVDTKVLFVRILNGASPKFDILANLSGTNTGNQTIPTSLPANGGTAANVSGTVAIAHGGTGATDAANARKNLGISQLFVTRTVSASYTLNKEEAKAIFFTDATPENYTYVGVVGYFTASTEVYALRAAKNRLDLKNRLSVTVSETATLTMLYMKNI